MDFDDAFDLGLFAGSPTAAARASAGELCFDDLLAARTEDDDDAALPDALALEACCRPLRCLNPSHRGACALCTEAPTDYKAVELAGDPGKRNGEKKLRALVIRVKEWSSSKERAAALPEICALLAPELAGAARTAMTNRNSQNLTKPMLLAMCRHWGYKSNLWVARGSRARRAEAPPAVSSPAVSPATVVDTGDAAMRAACRDAGAANAYLERLSAIGFAAAQSAAGQKVRELAQADTAAAALYTRIFKFGRLFIERALQWARDFLAAAREKLVHLSWRLHDGDVLDEVAAEFEHICSALRRHCEGKQVAIRRVRMLPFLPPPTIVTLSEMSEVLQGYQELLGGLEGLSSMALRSAPDDMVRMILSQGINLAITQVSLCMLASEKREKFYQALQEQKQALDGADPAVGGLFTLFADQFHRLQPVLMSMPKVADDLQHSSSGSAGGELHEVHDSLVDAE